MNIDDKRLEAYIIWLPILRSDNRRAAIARTGEFSDNRVTYYWDDDRITGNIWRSVLNLSRRIAWDVYLLYDADSQWDNRPTFPGYWMHQLGGVTHAPRLNRSRFASEARKMLAADYNKSHEQSFFYDDDEYQTCENCSVDERCDVHAVYSAPKTCNRGHSGCRHMH